MSDSSKPHGLWSPPGSSVHGIFQARVLEWGAIAFSEREEPVLEISVKQVFLEPLHPQLLQQIKLKEVSVKSPTPTAGCGRAEQSHRPEGSPGWSVEGAQCGAEVGPVHVSVLGTMRQKRPEPLQGLLSNCFGSCCLIDATVQGWREAKPSSPQQVGTSPWTPWWQGCEAPVDTAVAALPGSGAPVSRDSCTLSLSAHGHFSGKWQS